MPRVNIVHKARKSPGTCGKCGKEIPAGASYRHWSFCYGGKRLRCTVCPGPRASELTSSDKLSRIYAAQESIGDARGQDDLVSALDDAIGEAQDVSDEYRDGAANILEHFPSSEKADEMEQSADAIESWRDELETAKDAIESDELTEKTREDGKTKFFVNASEEEFESEEDWHDHLKEIAEEAAGSLEL